MQYFPPERPSDVRQARLELIVGIHERLARSDAAMGALREALDTGQPAAVLRNVVLHGLADHVRGAVGLELLGSRVASYADVAGVLGVLNTLQEARLQLLDEVANFLRRADGSPPRAWTDELAVDVCRRAELEALLVRLPPPSG